MEHNNTSLIFEPILRKEELDYYTEIFQSVKEANNNIGLAENIAPLLKTTNLNINLLGKIWDICDADKKGYFTQDDFLCCMKFVSACQNGLDLEKTVLENSKLPLVEFYNNGNRTKQILRNHAANQKLEEHFKTFEFYQENGHVSGTSAKEIFTKYKVEQKQLLELWTLVDVEERGKLNVNEFIVAMLYLNYLSQNKNAIIPETIPDEILKAVLKYTDFKTKGNPSEKEFQLNLHHYREDYKRFELDKEGCANVNELVVYFKKSGLPDSILAEIWDLADINNTGKLNLDRFLVGMALIENYKTYKSLPTDPPSSIDFIFSSNNKTAHINDFVGETYPVKENLSSVNKYETKDSDSYLSHKVGMEKETLLKLQDQINRKKAELEDLNKKFLNVSQDLKIKEERLRELQTVQIKQNKQTLLVNNQYEEALNLNKKSTNDLDIAFNEYKTLNETRNLVGSKNQLEKAPLEYYEDINTQDNQTNRYPSLSYFKEEKVGLNKPTVESNNYKEQSDKFGYRIIKDMYKNDVVQTTRSTPNQRRPNYEVENIDFVENNQPKELFENKDSEPRRNTEFIESTAAFNNSGLRYSSFQNEKPYHTELGRSYTTSVQRSNPNKNDIKTLAISSKIETQPKSVDTKDFLEKNIEEEFPDVNDLFKN